MSKHDNPTNEPQNEPRDYFKDLGVSREATPAQIQKAYRDLAIKYHPDKNQGDLNEAQKAGEAYAILSDPNKREVFEMYGNYSDALLKQYETVAKPQILAKLADLEQRLSSRTYYELLEVSPTHSELEIGVAATSKLRQNSIASIQDPIEIRLRKKTREYIMSAMATLSDSEKRKNYNETIGIKAEKAGGQISITVENNPTLQRRNFDPKLFTHRVENGKVVESYKGADGSREIAKGNFQELKIGNKNYRIVISEDLDGAYASYDPSRDLYVVGPKARADFKKNPELFYASFLHEAGHDEYFSLDEKTQKNLNSWFLNDPSLKKMLVEFAQAIYKDKFVVKPGRTAGEDYWMTHKKDNLNTTSTILAPDGQKGLKDTRSIAFGLNFNGTNQEVLIGALVTEMISYMSPVVMGEQTFRQLAEQSRQKRGHVDMRYEIAKQAWEYIQANGELDQFFKTNIFPASNAQTKNKIFELMQNNQ